MLGSEPRVLCALSTYSTSDIHTPPALGHGSLRALFPGWNWIGDLQGRRAAGQESCGFQSISMVLGRCVALSGGGPALCKATWPPDISTEEWGRDGLVSQSPHQRGAVHGQLTAEGLNWLRILVGMSGQKFKPGKWMPEAGTTRRSEWCLGGTHSEGGDFLSNSPLTWQEIAFLSPRR